MIEKTKQFYRFKYLQTGITSKGLEGVYLPEKFDLVKSKGWKRTVLPADWAKWRKEEAESLKKDSDYVDSRLEDFIDQEWFRRLNGYWFTNSDGVDTYITGLHYYYLNWWCMDFGYADYRETDKEVFYFLEYANLDDTCYGILYNTGRRQGKSAIMGCWLTESITRMTNARGGIQGESREKAGKFYRLATIYPFRKLPDFFRPVYDTSGTQKERITFRAMVKRNRSLDVEFDQEGELESEIDYQDSTVFKYDGDKLKRYVVEEPGKTKEVDVYERWDVVKFTLEDNSKIFGKAFGATTVEEMEDEGSAGKNYWNWFKDSDFDVRVNGKTVSGMYACFLPAYCAAPFNIHGHPKIEENKVRLLADREAVADSPSKQAALIRKKPFTIDEAFYANSDNCQFNVMILQARRAELMLRKDCVSRGNFEWVDNKRDGDVKWVKDERNGKFEVCYIIEDQSKRNLVAQIGVEYGVKQFKPMNDHEFAIGTDPIQYGKILGGAGSKPASYVIRKYRTSIDGACDMETMEQNQVNRKIYKTGIPVVRYCYRPEDPTVYYEHMIKLCRYFGCQIHVEQQKGAIMDYFKARGYKAFIMFRPEATFSFSFSKRKQRNSEGTPASANTTQYMTGMIATHVQNFGHCYNFLELIDDLLKFDPNKTGKHDDTMAFGYSLLASEKIVEDKKTLINLSDFFGN